MHDLADENLVGTYHFAQLLAAENYSFLTVGRSLISESIKESIAEKRQCKTFLEGNLTTMNVIPVFKNPEGVTFK